MVKRWFLDRLSLHLSSVLTAVEVLNRLPIRAGNSFMYWSSSGRSINNATPVETVSVSLSISIFSYPSWHCSRLP